jgi:phytanoyl-CoA hydroxylase
MIERDEWLRAYRDDGYFVARGILPIGELDQINREIAELFVIQLEARGLPVDAGMTRSALHSNARRLLKADVAAYIGAARLTQDLPSVHRMLLSQPIMDLVAVLGLARPVVSAKPSIHIMSDELRIPNGYHKSPPHQDWRSMQGSLDSIVLWMPTVPVTARSHPLEVVPGSHRLGLLDTAEHIMTPTVNDPRIMDESFVPVPTEPGDVIVFTSFMVHRTGEQGDGNVRIALSTRFNNAREPTYVKRGFATPYKFSYRLDLMVPDFPTLKDVEAVFDD